ncbi:MAG TPA: Flp family type IVb pilin [Trinickia sp.]|jgi:pilus assembly protein Flp/PilA|uniref:Flp family type IVb pilin n=1 Tax=Trinickia sp. TaxID=2571163 RepID=UPI002B834263|nr:Flp family type IVb pilin [Trinickia sp.]HTI16716.1 Flp family type IVb pilin [Trinickia sp.]
MKHIVTQAKRFLRDEQGATMVEYGLMIALIAVVCVATITLIGTNLNTAFNTILTKLQTANGG